jgi:hypothetical protein
MKRVIRRRRTASDEVLNAEPLPLQHVVVDERHLITDPWLMLFQKLTKGLAEAETGDGGGLPPNLPRAILGAPILTTSFGTDQNHQLLIDVTIPISWANNNWGDVDRLILHLLAPDTTVDTQEGFVGGPGTGATNPAGETPGIIISDAANASKIVTIQSTEILIEKPWDPERPFVHFTHPAPTENQWWRAIVVSGNKQATNKVDESPFVRFHVLPTGPDVLGVEYAPLGLNFRLTDKDGNTTNTIRYDTIEGGTPVWGFSVSWENDVSDPRFPVLGGYDIEIEWPDGARETHTSKSSNDMHHDSELWTFGAPSDIIIWLVSWSSQAGNPRNSIVTGLTPSVKFHVELPTGPPGNEFADEVLAFRLVNPYYGKDGSGQKTLYLPFEWNKPNDRRYQGGIIVMLRGDGVHYTLTGLETGTSQVCELLQYPTVPEPVTFYILSVSTSGNVNEYEPGVTPSISFTLQPPPETTPVVSAFQATINYGKDEFGNNVYGYSGTWAKPNKVFFPEYQGVKIAKAAADGTNRVDLTGIETEQSFKTSMWPVQPESAIYLYAISVDVNGVERAITTSPRIGPLTITAQGGTITNDALPDLNVADFAAGVEPLTFINAAPDVNGMVTGVPKQTTEVFNEYDKRLYRWTTNAYKVVGSALDIEAATIVGGLIRAGAVATHHMAAQEILVGPLPSGGTAADARPPIFKVENLTRQMVGFFGTYQGWEGVYALNLRVGPNFTVPMLEANASGLFLKGTTANPVSFELTGGAVGDFIRMSPVTFDPTYGSIGFLVSSSNNISQSYQVSRGLIAYENSNKIFALARNPNWAAGELVIYGPNDPNTIRVLITGVEAGTARGIVRADRFDCGGSPGMTTGGLVTLTRINVLGGIVIGVG